MLVSWILSRSIWESRLSIILSNISTPLYQHEHDVNAGRIVVHVAFAIIDSTLAIVEAFVFVVVDVFIFTLPIISSLAILVAIAAEELEHNTIDDAFAVFVLSIEFAIVLAARRRVVVTELFVRVNLQFTSDSNRSRIKVQPYRGG